MDINRKLTIATQKRINLLKELGKRVKHLRFTKKMPLKDLAKHTGLTRSFLSQVEHGKASPSILSLEKIAGALNVPMSYFFEGIFPKKFSILRKKKEKKFVAKGLRAYYEMFVPNIFNVTIFSVLFTLKAGGKVSKLQLKEFRGEKFINVQKGKIELECFKGKFILEEGDILYCKCDEVCHKMSNIGNQEAFILWIVRVPLS